MKRFYHITSAILFVTFILTGCKKTGGNDTATGNNFSDSIRKIIPQPIIDSLRKWGMKINDGTNPPAVAGIYLVSPNICTFDNAGTNSAGQTYDNYKFRFSAQNNGTSTIRVDYKDVSSYSDAASDSIATFISGNGNLFTIFAQEKGVESGVSYTALSVYSGEATSSGIHNFQISFYMKDKGRDIPPTLIDIGKSRIFVDGDSLAIKTAVFSIAAPLQPTGIIANCLGTRALGIKKPD